LGGRPDYGPRFQVPGGGTHGTKAVHLAPATGKLIADLVIRGATDLDVDLEAFAPGRLAASDIGRRTDAPASGPTVLED